MKIKLIILIIFISGCTSVKDSDVPTSYSEECDIDVQIIQSYGDTIRIEYDPENKQTAEKFAINYCLNERQKSAKKNQVNCEGCCRATYICKSK